MRTKIITICLLFSILALFTIAAFSQKNKAEEMQPDRRMMQHKPMMRNQHQVMGMQKMGDIMHSSMAQCSVMIGHLKQMNAQDMVGGQMGINSMMGTTEHLKIMAEQMNFMIQNMDKMTVYKVMMSTKEQAEKMKEMHAMMEQTTNSLDQLIDLNQEMIGAMQKQPAKN